jgi:hypothetical protein
MLLTRGLFDEALGRVDYGRGYWAPGAVEAVRSGLRFAVRYDGELEAFGTAAERDERLEALWRHYDAATSAWRRCVDPPKATEVSVQRTRG